jgi:hypothetical protein
MNTCLVSCFRTQEPELVKLAKKLQKNNVAVDVVLFAEHDASASKLRGATIKKDE